MPAKVKDIRFAEIVQRGKELSALLNAFTSQERVAAKSTLTSRTAANRIREFKKLVSELESLTRDVSWSKEGRIEITFARSDSIAKFFAFKFVHQPKKELAILANEPFLGSGIYAIYYHGTDEAIYRDLAETETPIYIGKSDPKEPYAETTEAQGRSLHSRVRQHAKNIERAGFSLGDFRYRIATVQSGMQAAVEEFLVRLFRPIWNKQVKIAMGLGKHGDGPDMRKHGRSAWDTLHPGRDWADRSETDQFGRAEIEKKIRAHFVSYPPYKTLEELRAALLAG
jgi:hypothetical protein